MAVLKAILREEHGKRAARELRKQGLLPAVIYGHGKPTVPVSLNEHEVELAIHHGERILEIKLGRKNENVLIKDVQWDTFGHQPLHVDLTRVNLDERVQVTIPIVLRGTPAGASEGGVVQQSAAEVQIEVAVSDIPDEIRISVIALAVGETIRMSDLELPEGATLLNDPEAAICSLVLVAEEVEPEPVEAEEAAEPEVIGEQPEEGGEAAAE